MYGTECIVFGSNLEIEAFIDLQVLKSSESENLVFSVWCVCVYLGKFMLSITNNIRKSKLYILDLYEYHL